MTTNGNLAPSPEADALSASALNHPIWASMDQHIPLTLGPDEDINDLVFRGFMRVAVAATLAGTHNIELLTQLVGLDSLFVETSLLTLSVDSDWATDTQPRLREKLASPTVTYHEMEQFAAPAYEAAIHAQIPAIQVLEMLY